MVSQEMVAQVKQGVIMSGFKEWIPSRAVDSRDGVMQDEMVRDFDCWRYWLTKKSDSRWRMSAVHTEHFKSVVFLNVVINIIINNHYVKGSLMGMSDQSIGVW